MFLAEGIVTIDVVAKVSTIKVVDEKVEVLSVLEGTDHVDNKLMREMAQDIFLVHH